MKALSPAIAPPEAEHWLANGPRQFERLGEGWYRWTVFGPGIQFEVDRLRLDKSQWIGELTVRVDLAGARTNGGELPASDLNFSSVVSRQQRAKYLQDRANTKPAEIDWLRLIEEFWQQVLQDVRTGQPATFLRELAAPPPDAEHMIEGFPLLKDEPTIVFGDGGTTKSLFALYFLGVLAEQGVPTLYCDWEFSPGEHRRRLEALFGRDMPPVRYLRCERPLTAEVDRVRRVIRECGIQYVALDSVGFACEGPPETSEAATGFQRAARSLGIGSLWLAHVNRSETGDQKPFGSIFWSNGGRSNWNIQRLNESSVGSIVTVSLYHRKSNTGRLRSPLAFEIDFGAHGTTIRRVSAIDVPEIAAKMSLAERISGAVRRGPRPVGEIAAEIGADVESVRTAAKRHDGKRFRYYDDASGTKVVALLDWKHKP